MRRTLLDTNIFGLIAADAQRKAMEEKAKESKTIFYASSITRKELRAVRKGRIREYNLRMDLLRLFDRLIGSRVLFVTQAITSLSDGYYKVLTGLGGTTPKYKLENDLLIFATASIHYLDVLVSDDKNTMLSPPALRAYQLVNEIKGIPFPNIQSYERFKKGCYPRCAL